MGLFRIPEDMSGLSTNVSPPSKILAKEDDTGTVVECENNTILSQNSSLSLLKKCVSDGSFLTNLRNMVSKEELEVYFPRGSLNEAAKNIKKHKFFKLQNSSSVNSSILSVELANNNLSTLDPSPSVSYNLKNEEADEHQQKLSKRKEYYTSTPRTSPGRSLPAGELNQKFQKNTDLVNINNSKFVKKLKMNTTNFEHQQTTYNLRGKVNVSSVSVDKMQKGSESIIHKQKMKVQSTENKETTNFETSCVKKRLRCVTEVKNNAEMRSTSSFCKLDKDQFQKRINEKVLNKGSVEVKVTFNNKKFLEKFDSDSSNFNMELQKQIVSRLSEDVVDSPIRRVMRRNRSSKCPKALTDKKFKKNILRIEKEKNDPNRNESASLNILKSKERRKESSKNVNSNSSDISESTIFRDSPLHNLRKSVTTVKKKRKHWKREEKNGASVKKCTRKSVRNSFSPDEDLRFDLNGKPYQEVSLKKPARWVSKNLYSFLIRKLEPHFNLEARLKSEEVVIDLCSTVSRVQKLPKDKVSSLFPLKKKLYDLNICHTVWDFYTFIRLYTPFDFQNRVLPLGGLLHSSKVTETRGVFDPLLPDAL